MVHALSRSPSMNRNISRRRSASFVRDPQRARWGHHHPACLDLADQVREFVFDPVVCKVEIRRVEFDDIEGLVDQRLHVPSFLFHVQDQPVFTLLEADVDHPFPGFQTVPDKFERKCCLSVP